MPTIEYKFDPELTPQEQAHIKEVLENSFLSGDILLCKCSTVEAWAYPTRKPDFQVSLSCNCDAMRPLFSSTPESDE